MSKLLVMWVVGLCSACNPGSFGYGVFIEARVGWNVVEV